MVTVRFCGRARLSAAEDGSGGGLQGEKLQPAQRSLLAARLIPCHLLLLHFPLHLLKKIRHFHLFVVPQSVTLCRDTKRILKVPHFASLLYRTFPTILNVSILSVKNENNLLLLFDTLCAKTHF